jgi:uncharacterized protein YdiU (UPF0061 family)
MGEPNAANTIFNFDNTYSTLPKDFFASLSPEAVLKPKTVLFNKNMAKTLGLPELSDELTANFFSGNELIEGANPIAQAYAGHQFGYFNKLGDGRAILLGEHLINNERFDIQLKGSGVTPFSRRGDGRATLASMLREYLISECMHGLGIPTSRSLAVVATGEEVYRNPVQPGAVLTRVAKSHIRVGTFEYVANFLTKEHLQILLNYTIQRHFPHLEKSENKVLDFLEAVMHSQIDLVVNWMRVGFIHGVMNTDNMFIGGETLDYGPCAFMNAYHSKTVFSSIDTGGRYAFGNQPAISQWNLACLAGALMILIDEDEDKAIKAVEPVIHSFPTHYKSKWLKMMRKKMGLITPNEKDEELIKAFLETLQIFKIDYTNAFVKLQEQDWNWFNEQSQNTFSSWLNQYQQRMLENEVTTERAQEIMRQSNPLYIPRNHKVEEALNQAWQNNDLSAIKVILSVFKNPYQKHEKGEAFTNYPQDFDKSYQTFCGT